jgi:pyridoxal 5'-phosphate synthase pdxT subunit
LRVGVLALQGDFREHQQLLERLGVEAVQVKKPQDLTGIAGLVIPGGESTAISKLLRIFDLVEPLRELRQQGFPMLGTCAGMILLADGVEGAGVDQEFVGGLDIVVSRNAYGSQNQSFESDITLSGEPLRVAFIRAPRVLKVGESVQVLATLDGEPIAVRQGNLMAASFHPEITSETALHEIFVELCKQSVGGR